MLLSNAFRPDPRVYKEAQSLAESGFDMTILCWDRLAELRSNEVSPVGVKIVRIQSVRSAYGIGAKQILSLVKFWRVVYRRLNQLNPVLIHCHDFDTLPCGVLWAKLHHIPVIYDAHEYYAELVRPRLTGINGKLLFLAIRMMEKFFSHLADAVVTVDDTLASNYRNQNRQVLVIGHFPRKCLAEHNNPVFSRTNLTLLYAGRISIDRGALTYIDILRGLLDRNIPAQLIFVGVFTPASEEETIRQHALGMEKCVQYLGWIPFQEMQEVYRSGDIGLSILHPIPRYVSALPVKLFEYMANGLPVIASDFPAVKSIIEEAKCGVFVDPLSGASEAVQIIQKWWSEATLPRVFGENGRQAVISKYNWESQIASLSRLYRQLLHMNN